MDLRKTVSYLSASSGIISALAACSFTQSEKYHNGTLPSALVALASGIIYEINKKEKKG